MPEPSPFSTAQVRELVAALSSLAPAVDDADRIDRVRLFEELKSVAAAAQAVEARDFDRSQRAAQAAEGLPAARQGRGIASQVALARRVSPWAAQRWLGWAAVVTTELPQTFAALAQGRISEWRATLVARETATLSLEDRAAVDAELAPHLERWGDRQVEAEAKRAAYRLDPESVVARSRAAANDRRVTIRPAPDTMTRLTALLPVAQGVAAYAALCQGADTTTAAGDERGRGQIMADTLVERVTGQAEAVAVPVEIELVMTDETLLGGSDEPGTIVGHGPIPAGVARDLALSPAAPRWLRRLFRSPTSGQLAAMESRRRLFTEAQKLFIRVRDEQCRTAWCDAGIRHIDHIKPHARGGRTTAGNGDGTCEICNYAKEAPGWSNTVEAGGTIVTRTPTGHRYRSRLPHPPGCAPLIEFRTRTRVIDLIYHSEHHAA